MKSSYLIHFNKNHSKANGQFTFGDGDGDGIANDHDNQKMNKKVGLVTRMNLNTLRDQYGLNINKVKRGDKLTVGDAKKALKVTDAMLKNNNNKYDEKWIREIRVDMLNRLMSENKQYSDQFIKEYNDYKISSAELEKYRRGLYARSIIGGVVTAHAIDKLSK